jgi:hypothetical protein
MAGMERRDSTRTTILLTALAIAGCSNNSTTSSTSTGGSGSSGTDGAASSSSGPAAPCGAAGPYGTFQIKGTLPGTESICGLSLGSFDAGTLTIAEGSSSGATVTVANSGGGHIDVSGCPATVTTCKVSASCSGSTDKQVTVGLSIDVNTNGLTGTSQLGFNGCQAPGLQFTGTR